MSLSVPSPVLERRRGSLSPILSLDTGPPLISIKCVIVGDKEIGKTCFLNSYVNPEQDTEKEYIPTVFDTFSITKNLKNKANIKLSFYDTSGSDEHQINRLDKYSQTDVFIMAFAIDDVNSFDNIKHKWYKEIKHYGLTSSSDNIPIVLVGMKSDARRTNSINTRTKKDSQRIHDYSMTSPTSFRKRVYSTVNKPMVYRKSRYIIGVSQGLALAEELGLSFYVECSSLDKTGIENIFEEIIKLGLLAYENE